MRSGSCTVVRRFTERLEGFGYLCGSIKRDLHLGVSRELQSCLDVRVLHIHNANFTDSLWLQEEGPTRDFPRKHRGASFLLIN